MFGNDLIQAILNFMWIYGEKPTVSLQSNMVLPPHGEVDIVESSTLEKEITFPSSRDPTFYGPNIWSEASNPPVLEGSDDLPGDISESSSVSSTSSGTASSELDG